ncbi:Fructokinase-2 [Bienertia sinuspersici]
MVRGNSCFYRNPSADMLLKSSELNIDLIKQAQGLPLWLDKLDHRAMQDGSHGSHENCQGSWEVEFLTQGDASKEEVVKTLWFDGLKLLLVTDGEKGCRYFTKDFQGSVQGYSVKTIDTTGAGDAFDENKLKDALKLANACGALCTTQKGAIPALPNLSQALELIQGN